MENLGKNIIVLQRGWVVMGDLTKDGMYYTLKKGSVIRRWGTTAGLGEIALKGITGETVLDPIPITTFYERTIIMIIKCKK